MAEPQQVRPLTAREVLKNAREARANELAQLKPGDRVCQLGWGTDNIIHRHWAVTDVTKIYIKYQPGNHIKDPVFRFRRDTGASVPHGEYGGSTISARCQKPKPKGRKS